MVGVFINIYNILYHLEIFFIDQVLIQNNYVDKD